MYYCLHEPHWNFMAVRAAFPLRRQCSIFSEKSNFLAAYGVTQMPSLTARTSYQMPVGKKKKKKEAHSDLDWDEKGGGVHPLDFLSEESAGAFCTLQALKTRYHNSEKHSDRETCSVPYKIQRLRTASCTCSYDEWDLSVN